MKVNRIRGDAGCTSGPLWGEPIVPGGGFHICLNTWIAERPEDISNPGFDYPRFNLPYWQKVERMLQYAREKDMILSMVLDWNDSKVHPAAGGEDEQRYFRYAAARLGALKRDLGPGDDIAAYHDDQA